MSKSIAIVVVAICGVLAVIITLNAFNSHNGIIILDDYEHGVAFCQEEYTTVVYEVGATVFHEGQALYVINKGHEEDPEVDDLKALAEVECTKLKK